MNKYETIFLLNIKLLEKDQKKILDKIIKITIIIIVFLISLFISANNLLD